MPPLLRFVLNRLLAIPLTLLLVTAGLYAFVMLTPVEVRLTLYLPNGVDFNRLSAEQIERVQNRIIQEHHLRAPYPVQYGLWLTSLVQGKWGWSPTLNQEVLPALIRRTPVTAELTLYSLLFFIPLGVLSGVVAARQKGRAADHAFRAVAFISTSLPVFILAFVLLAVFYVGLGWFPVERLGVQSSLLISSGQFRLYTGLLTVDALVNGRPDIFREALRHLVMPVVTLSLFHWATLGRVTRAAMLEENRKQYVVAARARGIRERQVVWKHMLRNALSPALVSSSLSAASLVTGVFVVEVIYNFKGISELVMSVINVPDAPPVLGFAVYSVLIVLVIMFVLDVLHALIDPRVREGLMST